MSYLINTSFMFFCPIHIPFIFFCYLTEWARTPTRMLESSDERGHPCLVPFLSSKTFSVSSLRMLLVIGFSLKFSISSLLSYYQWMLNFIKCFNCIYYYDYVLTDIIVAISAQFWEKGVEISNYDNGFIYVPLHSFLTHEA